MSDFITFIGHSSLHIKLDGFHFLIDANFSDRLLGIVKRIGTPPAIDVNHLPAVTALLVTHGAHDHLDVHTYKYFKQDHPILVPVGLKNFIQRYFHNPIIELQSWTDTSFGTVKITAVPAHHAGFRISGTRFVAPAGYVLQGTQHTVYVSSDTAYGPHFSQIGNSFALDVACLPIGHYSPHWLMGSRHMDPAQALKAFKDLKAKAMIPIHWGSFPISSEELTEPIRKLRESIYGTPVERHIHILNPGENFPLDPVSLGEAKTPAMATVYELKSV